MLWNAGVAKCCVCDLLFVSTTQLLHMRLSSSVLNKIILLLAHLTSTRGRVCVSVRLQMLLTCLDALSWLPCDRRISYLCRQPCWPNKWMYNIMDCGKYFLSISQAQLLLIRPGKNLILFVLQLGMQWNSSSVTNKKTKKCTINRH